MATLLTAEQIPALSDGLVGRMIDQALKQAAHDLDDRGDRGDDGDAVVRAGRRRGIRPRLAE